MEWKAFVEGGVASIVAGSLTHPLDLIKVRMQLQVEPLVCFRAPQPLALAGLCTSLPAPRPVAPGPIAIGIRVVETEGARALFSGVSAAVLRQSLYSTTRLGLYDVLKKKWQDSETGTLPLPKKISAGLIAGGIGAAVGNPADVAMVRMQADGRLPLHERRNYAGVGDALIRMARSEGIPSLWRGSGPTVQRAMVVTAAQLATYDQSKEALVGNGVKDGFGTHVAASFSAGFVASVASNPIDVIKTRIMNMNVKPGEEPAYKGSLDCGLKIIKAEGPMALYKGFAPTVARQGPFAVVLFVTLEQIRALLKNY